MKVYNMTIQARDVLLTSAHANVDHTLGVCYHAHCSIAYGLFPNADGIEGGTWEGKRSGGWEKANKRGEMEKVPTWMA